MRTRFILLALLLAFQAQADLGGCLVYKARYVMKNGQSLTAWLPLSGYEEYAYLDDNTGKNAYCTDKAFQTLIQKVIYQERKKLVFDVYGAIHPVKYGKSIISQAFGANPLRIAFTDGSQIKSLHLDSIKYTIFLKVEQASWSYPEVSVQILDAATCAMMREREVLNGCWLSRDPVPESPGSTYIYEFSFYVAINYNPEISLDALTKEILAIKEVFYQPEIRYFRSRNKNKWSVYAGEKERIIQPIILQFRQKGIILVEFIQTC